MSYDVELVDVHRRAASGCHSERSHEAAESRNPEAQERSSAARARRRSRARAAGRCSRPRPPLVIGQLLRSTYRLVLVRSRAVMVQHVRLRCHWSARAGQGHRSRSHFSSDGVNGKKRAVSDTKAAGRHAAGRPHMSVVESRLCVSPSTWPSSCATTFRTVLGSDSGGMSDRRTTTTPWLPARQGTPNEIRSVSDRAMMMSPGTSVRRSRRRLVAGPRPNITSLPAAARTSFGTDLSRTVPESSCNCRPSRRNSLLQ